MTKTFWYLLLSIKLAPTESEYKKPLQAAFKSNPQAFFKPAFSQTMLAVGAKMWSGVEVAKIRQSISKGSTFEFSMRFFMAKAAMSEVAKDLSESIRLSLIPVREVIHWSEVSTIFSRVLLSKMVSGTKPPMAVIVAFVLVFIIRKRLG
ncbi:hypothetical protein D3C80_1439590 [compost metagenome]